MTLGGSRSISDQRVYAQDTAPTDERDGIMWVDTSVSPRDTFVYSSDSASWEAVTPANTDSTASAAYYNLVNRGFNIAYGETETRRFDGYTEEYRVEIDNVTNTNTITIDIEAWHTDGTFTTLASNYVVPENSPNTELYDVPDGIWRGIRVVGDANYGTRINQVEYLSRETAPHSHPI